MVCFVLAAGMLGLPPRSAPKIIHASVFKNGYTFVTREVDVVKSGEVEFDSLPESTFGTLWFGSTQGIRIKQITNGFAQRKTSSPVRSLDELLQINVGHEVKLSLKDFPAATGVLKSAEGSFVILSQGQSDQVVFKDRILGLTSTAPLEKDFSSETNARVLRVRFEAATPGKLFYVNLEKGLSWDAAYMIEMKDQKLTLTSRATIVDDLGELDSIEVLLSALSPDIRGLGSPESLFNGNSNDRVKLIGGQGLVGDSIDFISYDPTDNSMVVKGNEDIEPQKHFAQPTGQGGMKREDQFFYRLPDVRLKSNERGQFVLDMTELPYKDFYTLDIGSLYGAANQMALPVMHFVKFANQTAQPLTGAVVSLMSEGQLIGQSAIPYTPIGSEVNFTLGVAPDVNASDLEEELNRTKAVKKREKKLYDLMTLRGTLKVKNQSAKKIKIRVSKALAGEWISGSNEPTVRQFGNADVLNPHTNIVWNIEIEPGKAKSLSYEYRTYEPN